MRFRNIYLKSLRDYRIAMLGWGVGIGLFMYRGSGFLPIAC